MARRKKPEGETPDQTHLRQLLEVVANHATRSDKVSWERKMDNMVRLLARLRPLEDQIIELEAQKMPIVDEITLLRADMVKECVHPFQYLVVKDDHILCKFCDKRIVVPHGSDKKSRS